MSASGQDRVPRLLVVTRNASLVIGLTFVGRDWEVTASESLDLDIPSDVLIVDAGTSTAGAATLAACRGGSWRPPAIVIGDEDRPIEAQDQLLLRPFTIDELAIRIDELLIPGGASTAMPGTDAHPQAVPEPVGNTDAGQGRHVAAPRTDALATGARTSLRAWTERVSQRRQSKDAARPTAAWSEDQPHTDGDGQSELQDGIRTYESAEPEELEVVIDLIQHQPDTEASPEVRAAEPTVPADRSGAITRVASRFTARQQEYGTAEAEMRRRLAQVVTAGSELEMLVHDLPLLRSLRGVATSVVEEVQEVLNADTAAYFTCRADGFYILASIGLSSVEQRLVSPLDQPMLAEVDASGGGLLIDPIESAHAAVAGIGGAHTESFMAASVSAGSGRFGLLVAGRNDRLTQRDLDTFVALAREAAPGIAVAQLLRRLDALVIDDAEERSLSSAGRQGDLGVRLTLTH